MSRMLICGLGNPGRRYEGTRHNIGFAVVDALAEQLQATSWRSEQQALTARATANDTHVLLAKPQTFMNNSGAAVRALLRYHQLPLDALLVISDDLDIPFGRLRLRGAGSAGGHNGLRSIIDALGSDQFSRLRIGIGRPEQGATIDWVLSPFPASDQADLPLICAAAVKICLLFLQEGALAAMNAANGVRDVRTPLTAPQPAAPARVPEKGARTIT